MDHLALSPTPRLFPLELRGADDVGLIDLSETAYRAASFLDQRLVTPGKTLVWAPWSEIARAAEGLSARRHFIFHIGHVGSTLISRLVGEHPDLFSLREPALLRTFANAHRSLVGRTGAHAGDPLDVMLALWSRTWRPTQTAVIKATSFVSQISADLLGRAGGARAIMVFTTPPAYLRGVLGGPASREELRAMAPPRLARLNRWLGRDAYRLDRLSEGEAIAMTWLCEMGALHDAAAKHRDRVLWINFDLFLAQPEHGLAAAFLHLEVSAGADEVRAIVNGPLMQRYAKGLEHSYDADLRRQVLAQAEREEGGEVRSGMDWLGRAAQAFPRVSEVLQAAARVRPPPASSSIARQSPPL